MMLTSAPEIVSLKGGTVVSLPALRVLWSLEDRGFLVRLNGDALDRESRIPSHPRRQPGHPRALRGAGVTRPLLRGDVRCLAYVSVWIAGD